MSTLEHLLDPEDLHPIDPVETLPAHHDRAFARIADDPLAMATDGPFVHHPLTPAWHSSE